MAKSCQFIVVELLLYSFKQTTIVAAAADDDPDADVADFLAGAAVAFVGIVDVIYLSDCGCTLCKRPFVCGVRFGSRQLNLLFQC